MMNQLEPVASQVLIPLPSFQVTRLGLLLTDVPEYDEWAAMGLQLQGLARSLHWLTGDWLNIGEREYGETYAQAIEATGYSVQTLMNAKYVCARIPIERRRENLSYSHHAEVASLPPDEQDAWLDQAEQEGWSRSELRKQVTQRETARRYTLTYEQLSALADSIGAVLGKAPELTEAWQWLEALLHEEG
jgi:hypothetical protein